MRSSLNDRIRLYVFGPVAVLRWKFSKRFGWGF